MKKTKSKQQGKLIANGVVLEKHEMATVVFLLAQGYNIELIPKSNCYGVHTSDIRMDKLLWEMKAPKGEGKYLIVNTIQRAVKQSSNIIIDLRRTKRHQSKCMAELKNELNKSCSMKRLIVITRSQKLIELSK